jgi:DNA-binding CsgD family transcriptional regulator
MRRGQVLAKELKVLELVGQGASYRQIAEQLKLSKNTVMRIVKELRNEH